MAALNWVMLAEKTREPLALPREKWLQSFGSVSLSLSPSLPGAPLHDKPQGDLRNERKAAGIAHISNLRIVFVADSAISPTSTISSTASSSTAVETLSLPYGALEGRFVQPIFHSNYFEALCLPASDGNLNDTPHTVRLAFKEAGAFEFYTLYEEMKSRQTSSRVAQAESLPLYSPPPPESVPGSPLQPSSAGHLPTSDADFQAATVARNAEEEERRLIAERNAPNAPPGYF